MKNIFNNFLIQGWMLDPLEVMEKDEQDKYKLALIDTAITGKVQTDNPKWKRLLEKALSSIEETRTKYYEKSQKNGIKGKEYGIQGKEYGSLGGRPRKGESPEDYIIRKKGEDSQWVKMFNEVKQDEELIRQIKNGSMPKDIFNELSEQYSKETLIDVLKWIKEKM